MNFLSCNTFNEKCGEKEKRTYTGKNNKENASSQSHDATSHCQFIYKILTYYLELFPRNLLRKITVLTAWRERKVHTYKEEQVGQPWFSIRRYNLSSLFCIPNMNFLFYTVVEKSLKKNVERKNKRP